MLFKMLLVERSHQLAGEGPKPRQIFITQSAVLARKVKEYFDSLMQSFLDASLTEDELLLKVQSLPMTFSDNHLVKEEDREDVYASLPRKFSELEDSHFPVVTTVNCVSRL